MNRRIQVILSVLAAALCAAQCPAAARRRSARTPKPLKEQMREREQARRNQTSGAGRARGKKPAATPAPETAREDDPPGPGEKTVSRTLFLGPKTGWGFLTSGAPHFSPSGKNLGRLPAGTLFKYDGTKSSKESTMLVATIRRPGGAWDGPFLLDCRDIAAYDGDPAAADPAIVSGLEKYFALNGKIKDRIEEIREKARKKNPYFLAAQAMQKAYQTCAEEAGQMEREMAEKTGLVRSRLQDKLRACKYKQTKMKAKLAELLRAYRAWAAENPFDPGLLENDPQLGAWRREREAARAPVKELIPKEE